jgi:hypothetical protein
MKKLTKKEFLKEAVNYHPEHNQRMHPSIEKKLANKNHHLGGHPSFPNSHDNQHFEEKIASDRFKDVITKSHRYGSPTKLGPQEVQQAFGILNQIISIEQNHKSALEQLAIKVVKKEFNLGNDIDLLPNLVGEEDIDFKGMKFDDNEEEQDQNQSDQEEYEPEDINDLENTHSEIHKRKLINALTQGAAKKGHYVFHLVEEDLNRIDPQLVNLYGKLMAITDLQYWMIDDEVIAQLAKTQEARVGEEQTGFKGDENDPREDAQTQDDTTHEDENPEDNKPYVRASGRIFPVLVHELIKGIMEVMAMHGLPQEPKLQKHVLSKSDFLNGESWDIRLGPGLWEKFLNAIDENDWDVRHHLYTEIVKMPANEFNSFMKELFAGTKSGKQKLVNLAKEIKKDIQEDEYEKNHSSTQQNPPIQNDDDDDWQDIDITDLFSK